MDRADESKCFATRVERREADTLIPLIRRFILSGLKILSDGWRAYGSISTLPEEYAHLIVIRSLHFVEKLVHSVYRTHDLSAEN